MRKIFTLALAAAAVLSVSAQQKAPGFTNLQKHPELSIKAEKSIEGKQVRELTKVNAKAKPFEKDHMVTRNSRAVDVIYTAPGEESFYAYSSDGYYYYYFWITYGTTDAFTNISFDGNDVYFKDLIYNLYAGTYVKGTKDGNTITVNLPQNLAETNYVYEDTEEPENSYDESYIYVLTMMQKYTYTEVDEETGEETTYTDYVEAEGDYVATYVINEDGSIELTGMPEVEYDEDGYLIYPDLILGVKQVYVDNLTGESEEYWAGYGDWKEVFTTSNALADVITLPEGIRMESDWVLSAEEGGKFLSVGFDGNDVYVLGFSELIPDAVIKGTLNEDGQYVFPASQLLGYSEDYGLMIYLKGTATENYYEVDENGDPIYGEDGYPIYIFEDLVFNYDSRSQRLVSAKDQIMWENAAENRIYYWTYWTNPKFMVETADDMNANPVDPIFNYYYEGYNEFNWTMPTTNIYGYLLDTDRMYYNVYINGALYTYYTDECWIYDKNTYEYYTDEEMTDIPYDAFEYNYMYWYSGATLGLSAPVEGIESFGVQVFFQGYDNVLYASNLVTATINNDGEWDGLAAVAQEEGTSVYYNLAGARVANPENGIYVKVTTYADGSKKAQKVAIR